MPTSAGPNLQGDSNLVLAFDTSDFKNSYRGIPKTNISNTIVNTYGENTGADFKTHYYTWTANIPQIGNTLVTSCNIYNNYPASGICCVQLFGFGNVIAVTGNTLYTYSIIYRSATGYMSTNAMYRYEYGASGYIAEQGVFDSGKQTYLGDGWYLAYNTFTTQASTTYLYAYFFEYEYSTYNTYDIVNASIIPGNYVPPAGQFLGVAGTRTNTTGLLDLTGKTTLDLSNAVYGTDGQITFDGVSSQIYSSNTAYNKVDGNPLTVALWMKPGRNAGQYQDLVGNRFDSSLNWMLYQHTADGSIQLHGTGQYKSSYIPTLGVWINVVATVTEYGLYTLYVNGVVQQTVYPYAYSAVTPSFLSIGAYGASKLEPYLGSLAKVSLYNRALSADEVVQNYNQFKTRFNS